MHIYKLKGDPKLMGDIDPKYGGTWWGYTHEADLPVMFNSHEERLLDGMTIVAEDQERKTSASGNDYLRLKKVKVTTQQADDPFPDGPKDEPSLKKKWDETIGVKKTVSSAYLKDLSDYPVRLYNGNLNYAKEAGLNLITDQEDRRVYLEYITDVCNELLSYSDKIRGIE